MTVWHDDEQVTPRSDTQLFDRHVAAERHENWSPNFISDSERCQYWGYDDAAGWLFEWRPTWTTGSQFESLYLNIVDADHHVLTRHEFEAVVFENTFGQTIGLAFRGTLTQGDTADEFVITFEDWCRALPMTLSIDQEDGFGSAAVLTQTDDHVWTFTRSTRPAGHLSSWDTFLTINGTRLTINDAPTEDLESIEAKIFSTNLAGGFATCAAGRYSLFRLSGTYGDDTSVDPSLLFIELRLGGVQSRALSRPDQSLIKAEFQIEVIREPGFYIAGLHESLANTSTFPVADRDLADGDGARMSTLNDWFWPDATGDNHGVRWTVQFTANRWRILFGFGNNLGGPRNTWLFEPVDAAAAREVGLRPGVIDFVGVRPFSLNIEADGSRPPAADPDPLVAAMDAEGKRIRLHVHSAETLFYHTVSRTLIADFANWSGIGSGFMAGVVTRDAPPNRSGLGQIDRDTERDEFLFGFRETDAAAGETVTVQVIQFQAGYELAPGTGHPGDLRYFDRKLELWANYSKNGVGTKRVKFVPADGRILTDDDWSDPIDWINKDGVGSETVTTSRGWFVPAACPDYEEHQHHAPILQRVTWKNETFLLPRTAPRRWTRTVDTADGERLLMKLEFFQPDAGVSHYTQEIGWQFTAYHADDLAFPYRSIFRFGHGGAQHESIHGERPPFNAWRSDAANSLSLIWHREHTDRLPAEVTVEPLTAPSPRGYCVWTWSADADDWLPTDDQTLIAGDEGDRYQSWTPIDRGVTDGETRTTDSIIGYTGNGDVNVSDEAVWWSPDGVAWELIMTGIQYTEPTGSFPYRPPAPTDPPTAEGDIYRALGIYPDD